MNYAEKLRDPRWQKKRLEILQRDEFKCTFCGDTETELHVHHKKYSGDPWDVNESHLQTLCKHCHTALTYYKKVYNKDFDPFDSGKYHSPSGPIVTCCHSTDENWCEYLAFVFDDYDKITCHKIPIDVLLAFREMDIRPMLPSYSQLTEEELSNLPDF
jgi:hypothetical protein